MLKFLALNIYDFMKKLVFDPQPRQNYPFKKMSMNPEIQGNVKFPSSDKSMQEFVRGAFSERKGYSGNAYFAESQQGHFSADLDATFTNCIIDGSLDDEIGFDNDQTGGFAYLFENCVLKTKFNSHSSWLENRS